MKQTIAMVHGSGGQATGELIRDVFAKAFDNKTLNLMEDSAAVPGSGTIAITTDRSAGCASAGRSMTS